MRVALFMVTLFFVTSTTFSQLQEVHLDWQYNTSQYQTADTDSIFIDSDSQVDILIHSWFLYEETYDNLGIEVLVKDHDENFITTPTSIGQTSIGLIRDCHQSGSADHTAYIYSNNSPIVTILNNDTIDNNYSNGYKKIPFDFEAADGIHCGFLFVRYEVNGNQELIVTVEGYYWNPVLKSQTGGTCSCNNDYLSLTEQEPNQINIPFQFYNFIGQKIQKPQGLVLKVYESGLSKKVYITD